MKPKPTIGRPASSASRRSCHACGGGAGSACSVAHARVTSRSAATSIRATSTLASSGESANAPAISQRASSPSRPHSRAALLSLRPALEMTRWQGVHESRVPVNEDVRADPTCRAAAATDLLVKRSASLASRPPPRRSMARQEKVAGFRGSPLETETATPLVEGVAGVTWRQGDTKGKFEV